MLAYFSNQQGNYIASTDFSDQQGNYIAEENLHHVLSKKGKGKLLEHSNELFTSAIKGGSNIEDVLPRLIYTIPDWEYHTSCQKSKYSSIDSIEDLVTECNRRELCTILKELNKKELLIELIEDIEVAIGSNEVWI